MNRRRLRSTATRVLRAESCAANTEVSILLTDNEQIAQLNKDYRDIAGPTDVLSFSQHEGEDGFEAAGDENLLGDVVISVEMAQKQADERGGTLEDELDLLLAHGLLHLLGYDHAEPAEAERMFALQKQLLGGQEGQGTRD